MKTRNKLLLAIASGLIVTAGIIYELGPGPEFKPIPSPVVVTPSPEPTPEPTIEPQAAKITASIGKTSIRAASISAPATWDFPTGDLIAHMPIPNVYRTIQSFTPPSTYVTGLENYAGYQPCQGIGPDRLPCAFVFLPQQTRWILLGACAGGAKPGNPPQCQCMNGIAGKSGKCR